MPTFTSRYDLQKDDPSENYDVAVVNANLDKIAQNLGAIICTSVTRPSSPVQGMIIFETDTFKVHTYWGASWWQERAAIASGNLAGRPAVGLYHGYPYYRTDRDWLEIYDAVNTVWRIQGVASCISTVDRNAAITNPVTGQLCMTTDTDFLWQWDGGTASWVYLTSPPVLFQGRQVTTQNLTNGVFADVTFTAEDVDTHSAHSTSTNTGRFTAPVAGWYALSGGVVFAASGAGIRVLHWAKNGTQLAGGDSSSGTVSGGAALRFPARSMLVNLAVGEYVTLQAYQDSGGTLATYATSPVQSTMTVEYKRPT